MQEKKAPRPPFGLHSVIPDYALSAWGMRTIVVQHGDVDVVFDRMGSDEGPHSERLLALLNERIPLDEIKDMIGELLRGYDMQIGQAEDFILYMDDELTVHANANASFGYCYVTAWLEDKYSLRRLADEIIADLSPKYDLVYVNQGNQFTDEQVAHLVRGDLEKFWESTGEWESDNRRHSVKHIVDEVGKDVIRRWQAEDPDNDDLDGLLDELFFTDDYERVRAEIEERDEGSWVKELASGTPNLLLRIWAIDEDSGWSFTEVTPEMVLDQPGFEFIERTEENVAAIQYALDNSSPEYSVTLGMWVVGADVSDLLDLPADSGFVEIAGPHLWLCNPFTGGGFMTEEPLTGWITVERTAMRTDKDAFGYSAEDVFGLGRTSAFDAEMTAVPAKEVYVLVNTEGGVGAADWRLELDDLPDYGPGDRRYVLTVPNDVTPEELTEAMDAYLGEYGLPTPWTSVLIDDKPDPLDEEGNPIESQEDNA